MGDEVDECYEFHPSEDDSGGGASVAVARQASGPKAMADTTQLGYLHEGRLMHRRRSVSLHADEQERTGLFFAVRLRESICRVLCSCMSTEPDSK